MKIADFAAIQSPTETPGRLNPTGESDPTPDETKDCLAFSSCTLAGRRFAPARFCAPMAGYTHSAFRRLVAELGGCGAMWTEMLAGRQILNEDFQRSPWVRRRPVERHLVYQLMVRAGDPLDRILDRLAAEGADAVDLNLACDAFSIRACEAGSALFENLPALRSVVTEARRHWRGLLLTKIRLGSRRPDWEIRLAERVRVLEAAGVDAITVHPRFFEDKFRRRARHEWLAWVRSFTSVPVIANGDLTDRVQVEGLGRRLESASAVMIGRMAIARPWLFADWERTGPPERDLPGIWRRMADYIAEDFEPAIGLRRVQMFTKYFAANYAFGHRFAADIGNAPGWQEMRERAETFFARDPARLAQPTVAGL